MIATRSRRRLWFALLLLAMLAGGAGRYAGTALVESRPLERPDAILMLGSHEWERIPAVAEYAGRHTAATVLLTYPRVVSEHNCHRCSERQAWLEALGVPGKRIRVLAQRVGNTREEALAALPYCRLEGVRRLVVVTSPYHTQRALATFTQVFQGSGIEIGVIPASVFSAARPARWWATPYDRWYVAYEWSALAFYLVRYGIVPFGSRVTSDAP